MSSAVCGWFEFEDGGTYVGDFGADGRVDGFGVCRGRAGSGEFAGSWTSGFQQSGSYIGSSGLRYDGEWSEGKRSGLGVEQRAGWTYRGEWTNGFKGQYGVRQSLNSTARYEGTWAEGLRHGYGVETNGDGGAYQGQWLNGLRHGYGIRQSATYEQAQFANKMLKSVDVGLGSSVYTEVSRSPWQQEAPSCTLLNRDQRTEGGGGFVLTEKVTFDRGQRKFGLLLDERGRPNLRQTIRADLGPLISRRRSIAETGQREEATRRTPSHHQSASFRAEPGIQPKDSAEVLRITVAEVRENQESGSLCDQGHVLDGGLVERYLGEWKRDKRTGYGVCQRSDGLRYEGEWKENTKYGYGRTTLADGTRMEGKYKNNVLMTTVGSRTGSGRGPKIFAMRSSILQEKVENAVREAHAAADNAVQKADVTVVRMSTAKEMAEKADVAAKDAKRNEDRARIKASEKSPRDAQSGSRLIISRIEEQEFLIESGATSAEADRDAGKESRHPLAAAAAPASTAAAGPRPLFDLRRRIPQLTGGRLKPDVASPSDAGSPALLTRYSFPWRKKKLPRAGDRSLFPERIDEERVVSTLTDDHSNGDRFRLQQPSGWDREGMVVASENTRWSNATKGPHFETRMTEKLAVPQNRLPNSDRPIGVAIRRELNEAKDPTEARHPRRKSLPSIIKEKVVMATDTAPRTPTSSSASSPFSSSFTASPKLATTNMRAAAERPQTPPPTHTETYLIERGIRKRVKCLYEDMEKAQTASPRSRLKREASQRTAAVGAMSQLIMSTLFTGFAVSQATPLRDWTQDSTDFQKMYALESPTSTRRRLKKTAGSTSDVSSIKPTDLMSRETVYVMSQRKREDMFRSRAEEEKKRRGEVVISLAAFTNWRNVAVYCLILINLGLAYVVYNAIYS